MSTQEFIWDVNIPFEETVGFNTLVTRYEDGKEQRRNKWSNPKRMYTVSLRGRTDTITDQVWDFYIARDGAYDTFYFENPNESPTTTIIGSGDGSTLTFNIPNYPLPSGAFSLSSEYMSYTETTHYVVTRSDGTVTFNAGMAPSGDITVSNYNFCRIVRFADDKMTRELFNYKVFNSELKFIEVLS